MSRLYHSNLKQLPKPANFAISLNNETKAKSFKFKEPIKNILITKKPNDDKTLAAELNIIEYFTTNYPSVNIIVKEDSRAKYPKESNIYLYSDASCVGFDFSGYIDLVVTLGGDGTVLHAASLFLKRVPPLVAFSMGSLGFLLPFSFNKFESVLDGVLKGSVPVVDRFRLCCSLYRVGEGLLASKEFQVMNEVSVHRGRMSHLAGIDVFIGEQFLTEAVADGIIVSTPTGSTAYSLSAGGPIVHPSVNAIILTPICPRSLSFRPIVLPGDNVISLKVSGTARGSAYIAVDGQDVIELSRNHRLDVKMSQHPIPFLSLTESDWQRGITNTLLWNQSFINSKHKL